MCRLGDNELYRVKAGGSQGSFQKLGGGTEGLQPSVQMVLLYINFDP